MEVNTLCKVEEVDLFIEGWKKIHLGETVYMPPMD